MDHIDICNRHDPAGFRPFMVDGRRVGAVRHDTAIRLAGYPHMIQVSDAAVVLHPDLADFDSRSRAMDEMAQGLNRDGLGPRLRGERYRVCPRFSEPPVMSVDRGAVSLFGIRAFGIHVNGVVRRSDGLYLWVGRRAMDKAVAPGQLDNMVAGGQPLGLSLMDNLLKEAAEEADIPAALAATARPVGAVSYCMEDNWGLKPDLMFCFDLDVPPDFTPHNTDGEMSEFLLMPVDEVARRVRDTRDFKFNVNLVIIDFLIRHGRISPDEQPDYAELVSGLRRGCLGL